MAAPLRGHSRSRLRYMPRHTLKQSDSPRQAVQSGLINVSDSIHIRGHKAEILETLNFPEITSSESCIRLEIVSIVVTSCGLPPLRTADPTQVLTRWIHESESQPPQ